MPRNFIWTVLKLPSTTVILLVVQDIYRIFLVQLLDSPYSTPLIVVYFWRRFVIHIYTGTYHNFLFHGPTSYVLLLSSKRNRSFILRSNTIYESIYTTYRKVGVGGRSPVLERCQIIRSCCRVFLVVRSKVNCSTTSWHAYVRVIQKIDIYVYILILFMLNFVRTTTYCTLLPFLLLRWVPCPFVPQVRLEPARPPMPACVYVEAITCK